MPASLRTPDLTELRSLVEAADSGTLGRAALRLHISQPALTKRLNGLEQLVGTPLLERSQRGVKLTAAGRRVYEELFPQSAGFHHQVVSVLTPRELQAFDKALAKLTENAERIAAARPVAEKADRRHGGARRVRGE